MKKIKNNTIKAGKGKVFRRIADGFIAGNMLYLGKTYYVAGKLLDKPLDELPEHYEEIDEVVIDEEHPIVAPLDEVVAEIQAETEEVIQEEEAPPEQEEVAPQKEPKVITVQDIVSMAEKVEKIYNLLTPEQKAMIE
ncbi:MAG: Spy/CpxP family protein refolding chaperone [Tannerellaceae bacterium]|nr:Spy/CpxP family protein refolding chaperone [Tannerellaceae bacterium]